MAEMISRNFSKVPEMWKPNGKSGKLMKKFMKTVEDKYNLHFEHASIDCQRDWFFGARLNFAENLLKYRDDQLALILTDEHRNVDKVTYAQLYEETKLYAAAFRKLGIKKKDVVVCYMSNRKEAVIAMLAVVSIGAVWSGALPLLGPQAVINRLKQVDPKILITVDKFTYDGKEHGMLQKIKEVKEGIPSLKKVIIVTAEKKFSKEDSKDISGSLMLDDFLKLGLLDDGSVPPLQFEQVSFSHPVFINYTSGTTGLPKAVVHGCGGLLSIPRDFSLNIDAGRDTIWLSVSCVGWVTWNMVMTLLSQGFTLLLFEGNPFFLSSTFFFDMVDEFAITNIFMSPSVLDEYYKKRWVPEKKHHLSSLKVLLAGGSIVKPQIYDFVYKKIKRDFVFHPCYGSTELMGSCLNLETTLPVYQGELNAISLGDNLEVVNESGIAVIGEVGELVISKPVPNLLVGLWGDTDGAICRKTYFSKYSGKYSTGDYGIMNPHTNGTIVCCRSDETLKQKGCRFGSTEIYNVVDVFEEVLDSLCVSQYSKDMDERAVLFLKMRQGHVFNETLVRRIREAIAKELTPRHVPEVILPTKDIPINLNGKKMEIIVKKIINKLPYNPETVVNPESLEYYRNVKELQIPDCRLFNK
ncbi:hypothetical protein JTE90_018797 [Oedothorax gibbosus]|uniref:Acetoacetyl-CoA synthetase n=1 Tax=Oedothorax gibbosus TaxID=931172 RepID=A0AAV6TS52_9ARAC|nr:hypothetical protein JTE90_018797 [Oedothorax gibbosus]